MKKQKRNERQGTVKGHRGTGFAGPLVAPPLGGGAAGASGGESLT